MKLGCIIINAQSNRIDFLRYIPISDRIGERKEMTNKPTRNVRSFLNIKIPTRRSAIVRAMPVTTGAIHARRCVLASCDAGRCGIGQPQFQQYWLEG